MITPPSTLTIAPIEDADIPGVIALWQHCGLTRPWNDPAADIALARKGVDVIGTYHSNKAEADATVSAIAALGRKALMLQLDSGTVAAFPAFVAAVQQALATHDPDVIAIADRVLRLDRGRVIGEDEQAASIGRAPAHVAEDAPPVLRVTGVSKSFRVGPETIQAVRAATLDWKPATPSTSSVRIAS